MTFLHFLAKHGQTISSLLLAFIGCLSVYVAVLSARINNRQRLALESQIEDSRQHNRLSVRPILHTWGRTKDGCAVIEVENNGIGPAIITSATITGTDFEMPVGYEAYEKVLVAAGFIPGDTGKVVDQIDMGLPYALRPGHSVTLLRVRGQGWGEEKTDRFLEYLRHNFCLSMEYESVYKEQFSIKNGMRNKVDALAGPSF